jgi:hypothetical protein
VVLLFLLDMREGIAERGAGEFKDAHVINRGNVLFHCEGILAKKGILILGIRRAGGGSGGEGLALCGGGGHGLHLLAAEDAVDGCEVALLGRAEGREEGRAEGRTEGRTEGRIEAVILLASSYRQTDPSLTAEDAVRRAAELLDPEHSLSIEDLIPRIY